jgi:benzoyl-CoA reductase subunit C
MAGYEPLRAMEPFRRALRDPDAYARRSGGAIGYRCVFVPEEIVRAAGMHPHPLYGTPEPVGLADSYFQPCTCEFVRNLFDHALGGRFAFLRGLAMCNTCDGLRRLWDLWGAYVDGPPVYMINNPQKLGRGSGLEYQVEELRRFTAWVEGLAGRKVTEEGIEEQIGIHNATRGLMRALNALRREDPPLLTGVEALEAGMAVTLMPGHVANPLVEELIGEARGREAPEGAGARILVTGSILDSPALVAMIEEEGGLVVADDLCTSSKWYWHDVERRGGALESLAHHLDSRPVCACMHPMEARFAYLEEMAEEFAADAIIDFNMKYCHPFLYEAPLLQKHFEARDFAVSVLEIGHDMSGHGQLRTRIQAFLEMMD